jgi:hypothetical protein
MDRLNRRNDYGETIKIHAEKRLNASDEDVGKHALEGQGNVTRRN